jgi:hypothetical protein
MASGTIWLSRSTELPRRYISTDYKPAPGPWTQFRLGDTLGPMTNFSGMLDEIAVYDRALTPEEVYRLANDEVFADAFDLEP